MIDEDELQTRIRALAEGPPPVDLLDRAMGQSVRSRRWRLGVTGAVATAAVIAGSFAAGSALASRNDAGTPATDQPTAVPTDIDDIPADLTGKALAEALELPSIEGCGGLVMETGTDSMLCLPDLPGPTMWALMYQLRGYERTDTVAQLAEADAEMNDLSNDDDGEHDSDAIRELMERRSVLFDQLYAEQGHHPYTGFGQDDEEPTDEPTSSEPTD